MSLRPAAIIEQPPGGNHWVVIHDDSDYDVALVVPLSWGFRRVLPREELKRLGTIHEIGSVYVCTTRLCSERYRGYSREPSFCAICMADLTEIPQGETLAGV
ncbi:MAG: hypothetical protein ABW167_07570 [Baekduia sp.]